MTALAASAGPAGFGGGEGVVCTGTAVPVCVSVCSGTEVPSTDKHTHQNGSPAQYAVQDFDDLLLGIGVYLLSRDRREGLARQLASKGVTPADVQLVWDYVQGTSESVGAAKTFFAALLKDEKRLAAALDDLRRHAARQPKPERRWAPGEGDRMRNRITLEQERRQWEEADREHFVRCMGRDGIPREVALAEWHAARGRE